MSHTLLMRCENCNMESEKLIKAEAKDFRKNHIGRDKGGLSICDRCNTDFSKRRERAEDILNSESEKRLIVAGPGTGKTYTFGEVIRALPDGSSALVFTLINNLANELERDLGEIENKTVKVNTFHGYCKEMLHSKVELNDLTDKFTYTPILPVLIEQDAALLGKGLSQEGFNKAFANIDDESEEIDFYLDRGSYYNAVSHIDSVYRVFRFFKEQNDKIPAYQIVIADEYQDFNKLEAAFIELLALKSKALVAGDDDQALYGFRGADKELIQKLHDDDKSYDNKYLPFCSRCTPVIVESTNKIAEVAQEKGLLKGRIKRDFISYWPEKYKEHALHPSLYVAHCSRLDTVPKYIEKRITDLKAAERIDPEAKDLPFMVIGPEANYHLDKVKEYLLANLDQDVFEIVDSRSKEQESELIEAYRLLREGVNLNLAWRIILHVDVLDNLDEIIHTSYETEKDLSELLPPEYREKHTRATQQEPEEEAPDEEVEIPKRIKILITNFLGSKGLAALHVIVIGLNNYTFPRTPASLKDEEVCKLIVALTRAKNSCALVTNKEWDKNSGKTVNRPSMFLSWLPEGKVKITTCRIQKGDLVEN